MAHALFSKLMKWVDQEKNVVGGYQRVGPRDL
jgi:hypothetical protein